MANEITEIERNIVFDYLIRESVPILISYDEKKCSVNSDKVKIIENNIMLISEPPEDILSFIGKSVCVKFSYKRVELFFEAQMKNVNAGLALIIPPKMNKISNDSNSTSEFSVTLFYESVSTIDGVKYKNKCDVDCIIREDMELFKTPNWTSVPSDQKGFASEMIRSFIRELDYLKLHDFDDDEDAKPDRSFLIPVVKYLLEENAKNDDEDTVPEVIFLNQDRIVLGFKDLSFPMEEKSEYALWIKFPLKRPLNERKIYVSFKAEKILKGGDRKKCCVSGKFTSIKMEDVRFISERFGR